MDAKTVEFVTTKTHDLMAAPSCNPALKTAAQAWLDAADKDAATPAYVEALKQGVSTIDELLAFAASEHAVQLMGELNSSWLMLKTFRLKVLNSVTARLVRQIWLSFVN